MSAGNVTIIGHRGYAERFPENTIPSLLGALDAGAPDVEWDVHVAACGTPVLFHDESLDRTTDGSGPLRSLPFSDLARFDAGSWFAPGFEGTRIPSLEEAIAAVLDRVGTIYCEVKAVREADDLERIVEILRRSGAISRTILISLDAWILAESRARAPELALGWVVAGEDGLEEAAARVRADRRAILDPDYRLLLANPGRTRGWVEEEIPLACWTVDQVEAAEALARLGVHRITTNRVGALVEWARSRAGAGG